jgi:hypothetical protein
MVPEIYLFGLYPSDTVVWSWQYRGLDGEVDPVTAGGLLLSDPDLDGDGWFDIDGIIGRRNGVRISGLFPAGEGILGNVNPDDGVPYTGDNQVRQAGLADDPQLTTSGLQFALTDGSYSNVFHASFLSPPTDLEFHSVSPFPEGPISPNSEPAVSFSAEIIATVV